MNNKSVLDISSDGECGNVPVPRFTAELKAKWIAALRSGKYLQGRSCLRDGDEFCCLGVLGDVAKFRSHHVGVLSLDEHMAHEHPAILPIQEQRDLASLNDNERWDFQTIAAHIEANIPAEE